MYARAEVNCSNKEHFAIDVDIYREDTGPDGQVAHAYKGYHASGYTYLSTSEPCSDVQTNKRYYAKATLFDTRFGPGIDVKETQSGTVSGHC